MNSLIFRDKVKISVGKTGGYKIYTKEVQQHTIKLTQEADRRGIQMSRSAVMDYLEDVSNEIQKDSKNKKQSRPRLDWFLNFRKRYPDLIIKDATVESQTILSEKETRKWFNNAHRFIAENDLHEILTDASRNFAIDETGFNVNNDGSNMYFTMDANKIRFFINYTTNRLDITILGKNISKLLVQIKSNS